MPVTLQQIEDPLQHKTGYRSRTYLSYMPKGCSSFNHYYRIRIISIVLFNFTKQLLSNWTFLIIHMYLITSHHWFYCELSSHTPTTSYLHICMSHVVAKTIKNEMWKKSLKFLLFLNRCENYKHKNNCKYGISIFHY